jgi:hypothetical protein
LYERLDRLQKIENSGNIETISIIQKEINKLLEMEDIKWRQRVKKLVQVRGQEYSILPCLGQPMKTTELD